MENFSSPKIIMRFDSALDSHLSFPQPKAECFIVQIFTKYLVSYKEMSYDIVLLFHRCVFVLPQDFIPAPQWMFVRYTEASAERSLTCSLWLSESKTCFECDNTSEHTVWHKISFNKWFILTQFLWTVVESENTKAVFSCLKTGFFQRLAPVPVIIPFHECVLAWGIPCSLSGAKVTG